MSENKFCPKCGSKLEANVKSCPSCGFLLSEIKESSSYSLQKTSSTAPLSTQYGMQQFTAFKPLAHRPKPMLAEP